MYELQEHPACMDAWVCCVYLGYSFRMLIHIVGQGQLLSPFFPTVMYTHTLSHPQGQHVARLMWLLHQPGGMHA